MKHLTSKVQDFLVTNKKFSLEFHPSVQGLLQTTPVPDNLDRYYESEDYISHQDQANGLIEQLYYLVKKYNLNQKYALIKDIAAGKKILDYGCGTGEFVKYLNIKKMDVYGFEPNNHAFQVAMKKSPDRIFQTQDILINEQFSVITLWHVLEHIPDLFRKIEELKNALEPNGKLVIAVPNYESFDATHYKEYWAAYDVPRHLWHFNQNSMHQLFSHFGMIIENVKPMYFDAFYVSMLSEKHKGSSFGFLRGLATGLISNIKATKTGQFSSLIYIIGNEN